MNLLVIFGKKLYTKIHVLFFDVLSIPVAWFLAYWLRYNLGSVNKALFSLSWVYSLSILMLVQTICYYRFRVYRGLWRYASVDDVIRIIKAVLVASLIVMPFFHFFSLLHDIPRSVMPLYVMLLITILCSARLFIRTWYDKQQPFILSRESERVLIIGAGQAGEGLVRDLKRNRSYLPLGIIDDDLHKKGLEIHGVRVLGSTSDLSHYVSLLHVDLIFIAVPSANSVQMRHIVHACTACQIPFRTLPGLDALASGHVQVNALREVNIEDLLGRDQVDLDWHQISENLNQKHVLVTGGGGSIGSELCRQIMARSPKKIMILDNSEYNLYQIDLELKERFPDISIELALISVEDEVGVHQTFEAFKPDIVFHAAAYKHVPMLEHQIRLAVRNNVLGTQVVAKASSAVGVEKFILISTDKAVNPTNVMGLTKRVAEIYCQNFNLQTATQFITVRFGNVLGSKGSVIPLFNQQLKRGGPLTVTHPEIERYFMTISEACQLILQAMVNGHGGEIFVLDMGEPIKIKYLAEQMIRLAGKEPGRDIGIKYTGLRPGEKLYEELFHETEKLEITEHEKLFKAQFRQIEWEELNQTLDEALLNSNQSEEQILFRSLQKLVPEYQRQKINHVA